MVIPATDVLFLSSSLHSDSQSITKHLVARDSHENAVAPLHLPLLENGWTEISNVWQVEVYSIRNWVVFFIVSNYVISTDASELLTS